MNRFDKPSSIPIDWIDREFDHPDYLVWIYRLGESQLPPYDYTDPEPYPEHLDPDSLRCWLQQFTTVGQIRNYLAPTVDTYGNHTTIRVPKRSKAAVLLDMDASESITVNFVEAIHNPDVPQISIDDAILILDLALFDEQRSLSGTWLHEQRIRRSFILPENLTTEQVCLLGLFMLAERGWGELKEEDDELETLLEEIYELHKETINDTTVYPDIPF